MRICPTTIALPLASRQDAQAIVSQPDRYQDRPGLRLIAWALLMKSRGLVMHQRRVRADQRTRGLI